MRVLHNNNNTPLPIFFLSFCYMWWRVFWHLRKQRVFFLCPVDICTFGLCMQCFTELKTHVRPPYFLFGSWSEFPFLYPKATAERDILFLNIQQMGPPPTSTAMPRQTRRRRRRRRLCAFHVGWYDSGGIRFRYYWTTGGGSFVGGGVGSDSPKIQDKVCPLDVHWICKSSAFPERR